MPRGSIDIEKLNNLNAKMGKLSIPMKSGSRPLKKVKKQDVKMAKMVMKTVLKETKKKV